MKKLVMVVTACLLLLSGISYSLDKAVEKPAEKEAPSVENTPLLVYTPPFGTLGRPIRRVSGGTRSLTKSFGALINGTAGEDNKDLLLAVLAPEHTGLTLNNQPALCWFQSGAAKSKVTITRKDGINTVTVFEHAFNAPLKKGVHCLSLADHKVTLAHGIEYQWAVAILSDKEQKPTEIVVSGLLKVVRPSEEFAKRLARTPKGLETAALYASEGIWYDIAALLTYMIEATPGDKKLQEQRAALLEKAGLPEVAGYDRR